MTRISLAILISTLIIAIVSARLDASQPGKNGKNIDSAIAQALQLNDPCFDLKMNLVGGYNNPHSFHTTLPVGADVHRTRESMVYALACMDSGEQWRVERAISIIRAVLALQDADPQSATFGLWPWYGEERVQDMKPADYNWADFISVRLIELAINHNDKMPVSMQRDVREAVIRACKSIIKRDVPMYYTNIAVMGTYVTCAAGKLYNLPDVAEYGKKRVKRFYDFTKSVGGFPEYNSPTYTVVALAEIARLRSAADGQERKLADELYDMLWSDIATHYHQPTGQWSGPHSRSYSTLIGRAPLMLYKLCIPEGVILGGIDIKWNEREDLYTLVDLRHAPSPCPEKYYDYFRMLKKPANHFQIFASGNDPSVGYTRHTPAYSFSSINHSTMWNQRRNILGYWKTPGAADISSLHVRFLHDGYDFASANIASRQQDGAAIFGVNFSTDGGDRHCDLDKLNDGKVEASDMRLRIQLEHTSIAGELPKFALGRAIRMKLGDINLHVQIDDAKFGDFKPYCEISRSDNGVNLDVVLYHGKKKTFTLNAAMGDAYIVGGVAMWGSSEPAPNSRGIAISEENGIIRAEWQPLYGAKLGIIMNSSPVSYGNLLETVRLNKR